MESSDFHNWQVLGYSQNWCQPLKVASIWQPEDSTSIATLSLVAKCGMFQTLPVLRILSVHLYSVP